MAAAVVLNPETCCTRHEPGCCPDHYARELEPADGTLAELQSVVVAQRHRGESNDRRDLEDAMRAYARLISSAFDPIDRIRHSMALAAIAIRYREDIRL
jgi:hypothetical protein